VNFPEVVHPSTCPPFERFKGFSMRVLPYLLSLVGICFAASDTLRIGAVQGPVDGVGVLLAVALNALGWFLSHRNLAGRVASAQRINMEEIASAAAENMIRRLQEPGSNLSKVVAEAAGQVVEHVRSQFPAPAAAVPAPATVPAALDVQAPPTPSRAP
jgi:hypothetical protein